MTEELSTGDIIQFNENHKWTGALGYIVEAKKIKEGSNTRFMVACTIPDNQDQCHTVYIFSLASKNEFDPLHAKVVLMPEDEIK